MVLYLGKLYDTWCWWKYSTQLSFNWIVFNRLKNASNMMFCSFLERKIHNNWGFGFKGKSLLIESCKWSYKINSFPAFEKFSSVSDSINEAQKAKDRIWWGCFSSSWTEFTEGSYLVFYFITLNRWMLFIKNDYTTML